jgi:hypothetical protein
MKNETKIVICETSILCRENVLIRWLKFRQIGIFDLRLQEHSQAKACGYKNIRKLKLAAIPQGRYGL